MSNGKKFDCDKSPVHQGLLAYFPNALTAVANVSAYGANKYDVSFEDKNWRRVPDALGRYRDAKARHAIAQEPYDPESELLHAAHEAWNALAVLELLLEHLADADVQRSTYEVLRNDTRNRA